MGYYANKKVLILGGGASGLMAAIAAARQGAKVTVLEKQAQIGKKILVTGNGRCNLTNVDQDLSNYHCSNKEFVAEALAAFGKQETLQFFGNIGIFTRNRNGGLYPYSEQASAVADALRMEAEHLKVKLSCNADIQKVGKKDGRFFVETPGWTYETDALILACGSKASAAGREDGYTYAKTFGHRIQPVLPALVQLRAGKNWPGALAGIRVEAAVRLYADEVLMGEDRGEVQLTAYGLSGIPVFQVSRYASLALNTGKKVEAELSFLPLFTEEQLITYLKQRLTTNSYKTAGAFLVGLLPQKLIPELLKRAGIPKDMNATGLLEGTNGKIEKAASGKTVLEQLTEQITHFRVPIVGTNDFEQAQICTGGVDVSQIEPLTMESRLVEDLYITGELLDVDGACGGYNLQWAWTSGYLAGQAAGRY